jgi:hypothetical protein
MSDIVILASRILMSAVFIVYGSLKFMDVSSIINNPGTKRFMDLVASGAAAPTLDPHPTPATTFTEQAMTLLLNRDRSKPASRCFEGERYVEAERLCGPGKSRRRHRPNNCAFPFAA